MSDQATGLRDWMKRSRGGSLARDTAETNRPAHEVVRGGKATEANLVGAIEPLTSYSPSDSRSFVFERDVEDSSKEANPM